MARVTSLPGIRARVRAVMAATVAYMLALSALAVYFGHGDIDPTKLGVVAITMPMACVAALLLAIAWRALDGDR